MMWPASTRRSRPTRERSISRLKAARTVHPPLANRHLVVRKPEGYWLKSAPIRRLSFDIECSGRKGIFPEPEHDSVIQIANYVTAYGSETEIAKVVFTLLSCAPISGATVMSFETEEDLLAEW